MKRKLRSLTEYKDSLGDVHSKMTSIITLSFEDFNKIQEFSNSLNIGAVMYKPRTKAGIIHDHICHRISSEFFNSEDIKVGEFNGVFGFLYQDKFFIRFKKMDARTFSFSSIPTVQNSKYLYQHGSIPGLSETPTILYVGYALDKTSSSIQGIYTACWDGKQLMWVDQHGVRSFEQITFTFDEDEDKNQLEIEKAIKADKRVRAKEAYKKISKDTGTTN